MVPIVVDLKKPYGYATKDRAAVPNQYQTCCKQVPASIKLAAPYQRGTQQSIGLTRTKSQWGRGQFGEGREEGFLAIFLGFSCSRVQFVFDLAAVPTQHQLSPN